MKNKYFEREGLSAKIGQYGAMKKTKKTVSAEDNKKELFAALVAMGKEKGIPAQSIADKIATAITVAAKRDYGNCDVVHCNIDLEKEIFRVYIQKEVVDEVEKPYEQITLDEAKLYNPNAKIGDFVEIDRDTHDFGRIVAQSAKHVIRQGIREAEHEIVLEEFSAQKKEIVTATVENVDAHTGNVTLKIGKSDAVLPRSEQMPTDRFTDGQLIKIFIVDVRVTEKGPKIMISRTHADFVRRLFETEVPEIYDGTVEVKAISREAGSRTKMAVYSKDENVDPIGACIGPKGARVAAIVEELGGEKIDIVRYSDDIAAFVSEALSPANVVGVQIIDEENKKCRVTVPDHQLSLAIGNKGQNARLAAKLTGWNIDIRPESGYYGDDEDVDEETKPAEEQGEE